MQINTDVNLQKALAMATFPSTEIIGTRMMDDPNSEHISAKEYVWLPRTVLNGGTLKGGNPERTVPVQNKSTISLITSITLQ